MASLLAGACGVLVEKPNASGGSGGRETGGTWTATGGSLGGQGGESPGGSNQGGQGGELSVTCDAGFAPTASAAAGCRECEAGEYCPGDALAKRCGAPTSTWDDDLEPSTPCVPWTYEGVSCQEGEYPELVAPGTATTNGSCPPTGWELIWSTPLSEIYPYAVAFHSTGAVVAVGSTDRGVREDDTWLIVVSPVDGTILHRVTLSTERLRCAFTELSDGDLILGCGSSFSDGLRVLRFSWADSMVSWSVALEDATAPKSSRAPAIQLLGGDDVAIQVDGAGPIVSRVSTVDGTYLGVGEAWQEASTLTAEQKANLEQVQLSRVEPVLRAGNYDPVEPITLREGRVLGNGDLLGVTEYVIEGGAFTHEDHSYAWRYVPGEDALSVTKLRYSAEVLAIDAQQQIIEVFDDYHYGDDVPAFAQLAFYRPVVD
jgi:hypothetical protein